MPSQKNAGRPISFQRFARWKRACDRGFFQRMRAYRIGLA
jgi:hypothetical protein